MSDWLGLALTAVLLALNAFFVGAEFALISARRTMVEPRAAEGSRAARTTLHAMENVSLMMAGAQLGITICSLLLGALSEPAIAHLIEVPFEALGVPEALLHPVAFAIALGLVTLLHVVLGEMVPKNIALAGPDRAALVLAPPLVLVVRVLLPVIWLLNRMANLLLRVVGVQAKDEVTSVFTRDEVAGLVTESRQGGLLDAREGELLLEALEFDEHDVSSVMIPLADVTSLPVGVTPAQAEETAVRGFSRFPLQGADGALHGYVHVKDLLETDADRREQPIDPAGVRPLPEVPAGAALRAVLETMQDDGAHLAAVRGPGGDVVGIVTLEDVLSELVGQIRDDSRRQAVAAAR
ncbi:hemolysin family protein [Pseudokineococcus basanitobsidens]|uniref:Hemolysin family protein n=1 Tax=Pseudokineococcus basanitobsidens TaxID=1926649 RepID=A0ABU8RLL9_9ACTN